MEDFFNKLERSMEALPEDKLTMLFEALESIFECEPGEMFTEYENYKQGQLVTKEDLVSIYCQWIDFDFSQMDITLDEALDIWVYIYYYIMFGAYEIHKNYDDMYKLKRDCLKFCADESAFNTYCLDYEVRNNMKRKRKKGSKVISFADYKK